MKILILNGPNMNLLGTRQNDIYGSGTLLELETGLRKIAQVLGIEIECQQSNQEGHLIDALHRARNRFQGVVFNPGGYSHTSVALRDAIDAIPIPVVEVHISNIYAREDFRHTSITAGACIGLISGLGFTGYEMALTSVIRFARPAGDAPAAAPRAPERAPDRAPERAGDRVPDRGMDRGADRPGDRPGDRPYDRPDRDRGRFERTPDRPGDRGVERMSDRPADRPMDRPVDRPAAAGAVGADGAVEGETREQREEREGKRRRRGRRGGRGRRRDERPDGAPREEGAGGDAPSASETRSDPAAIAARYANLKGAVVRRGIDVLAEDEGSDEPLTQGGGSVNFMDSPGGAAKPQTQAAQDVDDKPLVISAASTTLSDRGERPEREGEADGSEVETSAAEIEEDTEAANRGGKTPAKKTARKKTTAAAAKPKATGGARGAKGKSKEK